MASENMSEQQLRGEQPSGFDFGTRFNLRGKPATLYIEEGTGGAKYVYYCGYPIDDKVTYLPILQTEDGLLHATIPVTNYKNVMIMNNYRSVGIAPGADKILYVDLDYVRCPISPANPHNFLNWSTLTNEQLDDLDNTTIAIGPDGSIILISRSSLGQIGLKPYDPEANRMQTPQDTMAHATDVIGETETTGHDLREDQPSFMIIDDPRAPRTPDIFTGVKFFIDRYRNVLILLIGMASGMVIAKIVDKISQPDQLPKTAHVQPGENTCVPCSEAAPAQIKAVPFPPPAQGPIETRNVESATVVCEEGTTEEQEWIFNCTQTGEQYSADKAAQDLFIRVYAMKKWEEEAAAVCRQEAINAEFQRQLRERNNPTPTPVLPTATPFTPPTPIETPTKFLNLLGCDLIPTPLGCTPSIKTRKEEPTPQPSTEQQRVPSFLIPNK